MPNEHYKQGKIQAIDAITDWGLDFCLGNVVKYIARHGHKQSPTEDLAKALWYLVHNQVGDAQETDRIVAYIKTRRNDNDKTA